MACPECKGTGWYVGLRKRERCSRGCPTADGLRTFEAEDPAAFEELTMKAGVASGSYRPSGPTYFIRENFCGDFERWCEDAGVHVERGELCRARLAYQYRGPEPGFRTGWIRPQVACDYIIETRLTFLANGCIEAEERVRSMASRKNADWWWHAELERGDQ